jgi:hypothetical protein
VNGARRAAATAALALLTITLVGCTRTVGEGDPDVEAARSFAGYPLYWVGEHFEDWDLEYVAVRPDGFTTFGYGTCEIEGWFADGGCAPPLQIQIQPLCAHLDVVASNQVWRRREVRGAPVGTIDSAPVLFTDRIQIKVYRGQGSDPGLPMRTLEALRSANAVEPIIDSEAPIPPASRAVLSGTVPCSG